MKCKNCNTNLEPDNSYCFNCGAKVVKERITIKYLYLVLMSSLGWDNRFWATFRDLILRPGLVIDKYLKGTRKMYTDPFTFLAIALTVCVLSISFYTDEMIEISMDYQFELPETHSNSLTDSIDSENISQQDSIAYSEGIQNFSKKMVEFMIKFYYYISFLSLPFFTFIAFLVFGKPNNYAEHLVINSYIIGLTSLLSILLFFAALIIGKSGIYNGGQFAIVFVYYSYVYQNYRNYSFKQLTLKILRFVLILFVLVLIFSVVTFTIAIISKISE